MLRTNFIRFSTSRTVRTRTGLLLQSSSSSSSCSSSNNISISILNSSSTISSSSSSQLFVSKRHVQQIDASTPYEQNSSRRDQEAFLSQYDPLETLDLVEGESSMAAIHRAYETQRLKFKGNKVQIDRIERAYNVLTDPQSPYYERQTWQQMHRSQLKLQLLPAGQQRTARLVMAFWGILGIVGSLGIISLFFLPILKIWRAATR